MLDLILLLFATAVAVFLGAYLSLLPLGLLDAVVIADCWRWFAVPFLGVKPLSIAAAFGINLLVHAIIKTRNPMATQPEKSKTPARDFAAAYISHALGILITWLIAWAAANYWTHTT